MYKLLPMKKISIITCPKCEDVIEFTKTFCTTEYDKYFIYLEENQTIYYFNGKSIVCSEKYRLKDNKIHLQYESVWDDELFGKIMKGEDIIGGTKVAHFSVLIIEIDDHKIEKIEYAIDSLFWLGRIETSQRERDIIEIYESENYKRRYEFNSYMKSLRDDNINTEFYSKLTYKPKETLFDSHTVDEN